MDYEKALSSLQKKGPRGELTPKLCDVECVLVFFFCGMACYIQGTVHIVSVSLSLRYQDKDATSSTGRIYSVLVSHVVATVPGFAWVRQVLLHIEVNSHQVVCKRGPIQ